jgi:holo-[acyl-carrier protein] synthase
MIRGLGCDVVELARIGDSLARFGEAFARRVLADAEFGRWQGLAPGRQVEFLAGRFAAKEAIAKAAGCGIGRMGLRNVAIVEEQDGLKILWMTAGSAPAAWHGGRWHVSISHSRTAAFAVAVWEA